MRAEPNPLRSSDYLLAGLLSLFSLTLHLIRLNGWSPLPDEINYALCAKNLLSGRTLIAHNIMFFPPLFVYLAALLQKLGVELLLSVRLISAVAGSLLLAVVYSLGITGYPRRTALLGIAPTALLFSLNSYSRLGQVEILMLLFLLSAFLFTLRAKPVLAGVSLGLGLWVKETVLGGIFTVLLFILLTDEKRGPRLWRLFAGLALPLIPLLILSIFTGESLLFEISKSRGYDINMLKLSPLANLAALAGNIGFNLFPRMFYPWEFAAFLILAPLTILMLTFPVVYRGIESRALPRLVLCYLLIHLPFFFFFSRKFDYYLLPASLLLLFTGSCELSRFRHPIRRFALGLIGLLTAFNIYAHYFLYFNRGTHRLIEEVIERTAPETGVATSHPTLVAYLAHRHRRELKVSALFEPGGYRLNRNVLTDPEITTVLLKRYYYEKIQQIYPEERETLAHYFPIKEDYIDPDWSPGIFALRPPGDQIGVLRHLAEFAHPTGVTLLRRR